MDGQDDDDEDDGYDDGNDDDEYGDEDEDALHSSTTASSSSLLPPPPLHKSGPPALPPPAISTTLARSKNAPKSGLVAAVGVGATGAGAGVGKKPTLALSDDEEEGEEEYGDDDGDEDPSAAASASGGLYFSTLLLPYNYPTITLPYYPKTLLSYRPTAITILLSHYSTTLRLYMIPPYLLHPPTSNLITIIHAPSPLLPLLSLSSLSYLSPPSLISLLLLLSLSSLPYLSPPSSSPQALRHRPSPVPSHALWARGEGGPLGCSPTPSLDSKILGTTYW